MFGPKDLTAETPGKLTPISGGHFAFIPYPLPASIEYEGLIPRLLEEATLALGQLSGTGHNLPNPHMLIRTFQQREALLSSRIEGTVADQQELLLADISKPKELGENVREVRNYVEALNFGQKRLEKLPVCLRLIKELHEKLMRDVRGQEQRPGEFRDVQNYVGKLGGFAHARYIPPPVAQMNDLLNQFENFLHEDSAIPSLIRLALIHYQFEAIHPFRDGNGRIGRLILPLLLCDWKMLSKPLFYLSAYFDKHRDEYFDHLLAISKRGSWQEWIEFFLKGVAEESRDARERAEKLLALRDEYRATLHAAHASGASVNLVDSLFEIPAMTVPIAMDKLKLSYPGAKRNVTRFVQSNILKETPERQHPRLYLAHGIMRLVSAF
jgi:Fic family protein